VTKLHTFDDFEHPTNDLDQVLDLLQVSLDVRLKCAIADCPRLGLRENSVETPMYALHMPCVRIYLCHECYRYCKALGGVKGE
jgi:hypothetical protein